jgi:hypothetical protein
MGSSFLAARRVPRAVGRRVDPGCLSGNVAPPDGALPSRPAARGFRGATGRGNPLLRSRTVLRCGTRRPSRNGGRKRARPPASGRRGREDPAGGLQVELIQLLELAVRSLREEFDAHRRRPLHGTPSGFCSLRASTLPGRSKDSCDLKDFRGAVAEQELATRFVEADHVRLPAEASIAASDFSAAERPCNRVATSFHGIPGCRCGLASNRACNVRKRDS